jgi:beta-fructofuranosidase
MLHLEHDYLWDFWTLQHQGKTHLFYLYAPRSLPHPEDRHANARVGHAVSEDLIHWDVLQEALGPSPQSAWDDRAIWTGSVMALPDGRFAMPYTSSSLAEDGKIQRVGMAFSEDLIRWEKHPEPVLEADPRFYEQETQIRGKELHFRDPYIVREADGRYRVFVTARLREGGEYFGRGCIATATSTDLIQWESEPAAAALPGVFQLEVPQFWQAHGRDYLFFSTGADCILPGYGVPRLTGTFYLVREPGESEYRYGGVTIGTDGFGRQGRFFGSEKYILKLLPDASGRTVALWWFGYDWEGNFSGTLSEPVPVRFDPESGDVVLGDF